MLKNNFLIKYIERLFSALCHVKSYLRGTRTIGQQRPNNFHIHKDRTDLLNLLDIANVKDSEQRLHNFGKF